MGNAIFHAVAASSSGLTCQCRPRRSCRCIAAVVVHEIALNLHRPAAVHGCECSSKGFLPVYCRQVQKTIQPSGSSNQLWKESGFLAVKIGFTGIPESTIMHYIERCPWNHG
eukprot:scaffold5875_cov162-Skeletonema_dohrnii-CCMP3373.AAC.2